jgi:hypothetical protein
MYYIFKLWLYIEMDNVLETKDKKSYFKGL